jgi:hypothetical protein
VDKQAAMAELLGALGFDAMAREVRGERNAMRLNKYARVILANLPADKVADVRAKLRVLGVVI